MNARNQLLVKGVAALVILWVIVGAVVKVAGNMKPSPEKIAKFAENHPLDEITDPEERKRTIAKLADMMNQLEADDLRELEEKTPRDRRRAMFSSMTTEEQWFFMEKRMGRAFSQMMDAFNEMERGERKQMVDRALSQIRKDSSKNQGPMADADPEMVEKIASAGMKAYFQDSSAETKMDLAPLIEELQSVMSSPRRGNRRRDK